MLAVIFMVRLEATARLQEQTASLSSGRFVPLTLSNQSYSRKTRPADRPQRTGASLLSELLSVSRKATSGDGWWCLV